MKECLRGADDAGIEDLQVKMDRTAAVLLKDDGQFAGLPERFRKVAEDTAREVLAIDGGRLIDSALNLHNLALFAGCDGDVFCTTILERSDKLHCRLVERGTALDDADRIVEQYLRSLISQGMARLQMSKAMGSGIYVGCSERVAGFAESAEMSRILVQKCLGLDEGFIRDVMDRDREE